MFVLCCCKQRSWGGVLAPRTGKDTPPGCRSAPDPACPPEREPACRGGVHKHPTHISHGRSSKQPPPPPGHISSPSQQGGATKLATKGEQKCSVPPLGRPSKPTSRSPPFSPLCWPDVGSREGPLGTAEPLGSRSPEWRLRAETPAPSAHPPDCDWKEKQVYCVLTR